MSQAPFVLAALYAGCAALPATPTGRLAESLATIDAAEAVGAAGVPRARRHLLLAREQSARARGLLAANREQQAGFALMRAEVDAELALALAKESAARSDAARAVFEAED